MPSLTQGVGAALHSLVDLPRNSGHGLTHLPQHADAVTLSPATRLVCCSQRNLRQARHRAMKCPPTISQGPTPDPPYPGTQAAGSLQGGLQATHLLLKGPEPRRHLAQPSECLIHPSVRPYQLPGRVNMRDLAKTSTHVQTGVRTLVCAGL